MNVLQIVRWYLEKNGYDGLCDDDGCGCRVENLAPECGLGVSCKPGYKFYCDENGKLTKEWYIRET